jgi:hypothetical protein
MRRYYFFVGMITILTLNSLISKKRRTIMGKIRRALQLAIAWSGIMLLAACGASTSDSPSACSDAISNATGKWVTVVDNAFTPPGVTDKNFFSFNQPSVNSNGMVVFRARAKAAGGGAGGEPHRGVWAVNLCSSPALQTIVDSNTLVPDPNNLGVTFTETPSIPRIDISSSLIATRGNSQPAWTYTDPISQLESRAGTTGIFTWINGLLATGVNILGNLPDFSYFQVPGAPAGTKFDVFPGSPTATNGKYIAFKGNFTVAESGVPPAGKTGVYFRDISLPMSMSASAVVAIADTSTTIPGQDVVTFGSTAPPSAADGKIVFTGLDNEDAPTMGGIYAAPLADRPALTAVAVIGDAVPDRNGDPLADGSTFATFGEGLSYDGRYVAFWGAWGGPGQQRGRDLVCPTDGNKDLIAYCNLPPEQGGTGGMITMQEPVNQGIFLHDTQNHKTMMVARSGTGEAFDSFLYWVYSGRPPGTGSGDDTDGEPPRWRSSAFTAVDGTRGVLFKGSRSPIDGVTVPGNGIYGTAYIKGVLTDVIPAIEVGNLAANLDASAPADSTVLSVGIEREAFRNGWVALTVSTINPAGESWAGVYATYVPVLDQIPPTQ